MILESFFDRAKLGTGLKGPKRLYHYTSWEAAEQILRSQRCWAAAHDCTNDTAELKTADSILLEVVREAEARAALEANDKLRRILRLFLKTYDFTSLWSVPRTYLVCFSQVRDGLHQWERYGSGGTGVCLGLRLFGTPDPVVPGVTTSFMPVEYSESVLREKIEMVLREFLSIVNRADDIEHNWRLAMKTLNVNAAAWALTTKGKEWEAENEVRMIFLVREGVAIKPFERVRPDGTIHRYLDVPLTRLRRMPVEELIIGPNQNSAEGFRRAIRLLADVGYPNPESRVVLSAAALGPEVPQLVGSEL